MCRRWRWSWKRKEEEETSFDGIQMCLRFSLAKGRLKTAPQSPSCTLIGDPFELRCGCSLSSHYSPWPWSGNPASLWQLVLHDWRPLVEAKITCYLSSFYYHPPYHWRPWNNWLGSLFYALHKLKLDDRWPRTSKDLVPKGYWWPSRMSTNKLQ